MRRHGDRALTTDEENFKQDVAVDSKKTENVASSPLLFLSVYIVFLIKPSKHMSEMTAKRPDLLSISR